MPIKEYRCLKCNTRFEKIFLSEANEKNFLLAATPSDCCSYPSAPIVSVPTDPQFKGDGFYATDYKERK